MAEPDKVAAVRRLLPASGAGIYLDAGTAGPLPAETHRAMDEQAQHELATGRAHADRWPETQERMAEARAAAAAVLVGDPDDVALTHSTTDGMNLAVSALPWVAGDRVITTRHEHAGGIGPLLAVRDRVGIEVAMVDIGTGGDDELTLGTIAAELERGARAVVLSHVLWTTGAVLPVARIAELARSAGARLIVDGAQSIGAIPVAAGELAEHGMDALAFPAHKWLLGPEGMGGLWVRREFAEAVTPAPAGIASYAAFDPLGGAVLHAGARRFEASNYHRPSIVGFARSCGWLTMYLGLPWALSRAIRLARGAADRLTAIPGVAVLTPPGRMATLVTFRIGGWPAAVAVRELGARVFAISREVQPLDALRISVGFWNTDEELDRFAEAVELLARHTPESIPPRRTLAMLGSDDQPTG